MGDRFFARMASTQTTKPVYSTDAMQPRLAVRKSPRYTSNYDHIALQYLSLIHISEPTRPY